MARLHGGGTALGEPSRRGNAAGRLAAGGRRWPGPPGRQLEGHTLMSTQIRFCDLRTEADASLVEAMYQDILEPSFDDAELDPLEVVRARLAAAGSSECWGLCALEGDSPAGVILGYPYPAARVLLIGYLAVKPGLRSHGV